VTNQIYLHLERTTTFRDLALVRPLTSVGSHVIHQAVLCRKIGTTTRDIALVRPLTSVGSLVVSGSTRGG
jgi:hypothetical protein